MKNAVQLIAYADRLGGTLAGLTALLDGPFSGLFGGLHLLPFFHRIDGADAGFDPIDHTAVDARLGGWSEVRALASRVPLMADVIVNHVSAASPQFEDFLRRGANSPHAGMFLTLDAVFPHGACEQDLVKIYRPCPGLPFTRVTLDGGARRILWTTFTPQQIDLDVHHPQSREYLDRILRTLAGHGVRMVRLDAIGYAVKKAGDSCFMMAETFELIREISRAARRLDMEVLVEVHSHYRKQIGIAAHVDRVYDFALPPLVLHAIFTRSSSELKEWIRIRPENCLTVLDTHDGIGLIDAGSDAAGDGGPGLLSDEAVAALAERIHVASGGASRKASGTAAHNLDLYQINCTFYDALGRDDARYLLARAIQFFLPGVPQVYYVGLLAGTNDLELLARTGVGRDINRHYYSLEEIEAALRRPVVARLLELIRLRNSHPAFGGQFDMHETDDGSLELRWQSETDFARLHLDFARDIHRLEYSRRGARESFALDRW